MSATSTSVTLKALAVGEESPKDWRKYGITDASRRVSLFGADGKLLASLVIGKAVPGKSNTLYARGQPNWVAEVDSSKLSELPTRSEDVLETLSSSLDGGSKIACPSWITALRWCFWVPSAPGS